MRVLVYEHLTATQPDDGSSMYREGRTMRDALIEDLRAIPNLELVEADADIAFVIAPETDGILEERVTHFRRSGPVLASTAGALSLTRDKWNLHQHWVRHGVPTPSTELAQHVSVVMRSSVLKPRDGAGSCDTFFLCEGERIPEPQRTDRFLVQSYAQGQAASIAFLIGREQTTPLLPGFQNLSNDGRFQYQGGSLPLPTPLAERAIALGRRAIDCVPGLLGYVGVDLVLGEGGDFAIEINPRLTTSYIGLRAACHDNLAERIIALMQGIRMPPLRWKPDRITFDVNGTVTVGKR